MVVLSLSHNTSPYVHNGRTCCISVLIKYMPQHPRIVRLFPFLRFDPFLLHLPVPCGSVPTCYNCFLFFIIVLSFLFQVSSFLSLLHKYDFTHCPAVTEIYTFFLSLVFLFLSFFLLLYTVQFKHDSTATGIYTFFLSRIFFFLSFFLSLHNSACNRDIYFLPLWFSLFFKRSLYSQRTNSFFCDK
ncbi:unnamed protein product [Acanthosepion pharaonis]|uniref:Uncharacterized protein n=1 Tax=Acanthosepion pharaonis TaxID=158019 RepID=A0A812DG39_ACAPH|nr:unnamed protein product [Sepia pharaonis]